MKFGGSLGMKITQVLAIAGATAVFSLSASAQSVPAKKIITLEVAQGMAQEAIAACHSKGLKVSALVVDAVNMPMALLRDDGAPPSSTETAKMKATTAMLYQRPSGPPPGGTGGPGIIPGTVNAQGAFPIQSGDMVIGAIAVSGAPKSDLDAECATAGLAKFADQFK
jgi:uncharacterized protein GlcG (DUF336 family)